MCEIKKRLEDVCKHVLYSSIQYASKCTIYNFLIDNFTLQYYLCKPIPNPYKKLLSFRLSSHCLSIETGRYNNKKRNERCCSFCNGSIEDEYHFILECKTYVNLRKQFIKPYYWVKPSMYKLIQLFSVNNIKQLRNLGKYLCKA